MAVRWATVVTGALISLIDLQNEVGALTASALLCFYTGLRVVRPLPRPDGSEPTAAAIAFDLAIALFAIVISGGWGSPFLFVALVGVLLAGFAHGYAGGFAAAGAAAIVLLAAGFAFPSAEGSTETGSQVVLVYAATAAVAGYARRLFVEAAAEQAQFEDRVSRLTEANALLSRLTGVARALPSSLDLRDSVATAMTHLQRLVDFNGGAILVYDAATGTWRPEATVGLPAPLPMTTQQLPAVLRRLVARQNSGTPSAGSVIEPLGPPGSRQGLWPEGASGAYAPLVARGRLVALVALEHAEPGRFTDREAEILNGLAEPLALAIDNGLWFERLRMLGAEGERDRLARDLHDRFAQGLAYINLELDRLTRHPDPGPALSDLRQEVRGLLGDMRETQRQLRSRVTPEGGLADLLATELARFAQRTGLDVQFVPAAAAARLALPVEQELWRIAQEVLSNVERHAKATAVRVTWSCDGRYGRLVMADNGAGFDPAAATRAAVPSAGLTAMRERANAIGARLVVDSQPGEGTWISVEVDTGKVPDTE
jgi:signal transduction histidine kinase